MRPLLAFLLTTLAATAAEPIRLHPGNPHYFLFRGKPTFLLTSAEHYGAVLNSAFDYNKYLDTLAKDRLNMTRIFTGVYREVPSDFGILRNTLAPAFPDFIAPWERTSTPGAADGLNKFDLTRWNPQYFARLRDFIFQAGRRGIVVEVTLFCTYYRDHMWNLSPLNSKNNVNGIGNATNTEVLTLKHPDLTSIQESFVRKIAAELQDFDNVIFEICNEPYFAGVTLAWQEHISKVLTESDPARHLIAQNIANNHQLITHPNPLVSLFNFHYARPPIAVAENYHLSRAIGLDETGFDGTLDFIYRIQAWDFLLAGGAHYNNLDYSFTTGHEDGTFPVPGTQPGGGSPTLRKQLGILHDFLSRFDFVRMKPDPTLIQSGVPEGASAGVLSEPGRAYAVYLQHGRLMSDYRPRYLVRTGRQQATLTLQLPPGSYTATWWDPRSGRTEHSESFSHTGSGKALTSPAYTEDIALEVRAR
ncbi:MAG: cellulase family glycosylhydrolase [Bryobacterales bacterium]|nr:cellulase family glycosylhydrolase [Bryobacterales bacterium]